MSEETPTEWVIIPQSAELLGLESCNHYSSTTPSLADAKPMIQTRPNENISCGIMFDSLKEAQEFVKLNGFTEDCISTTNVLPGKFLVEY
jgi:hypothetical protein